MVKFHHSVNQPHELYWKNGAAGRPFAAGVYCTQCSFRWWNEACQPTKKNEIHWGRHICHGPSARGTIIVEPKLNCDVACPDSYIESKGWNSSNSLFLDRAAVPRGPDVVVAARVDLQPTVQRFAGQEVRGRWRLLLDLRRMHPLSGI